MILPVDLLLPLEMLVSVLIDKYLVTSYCVTVFSETPITFFMPKNFITLTPNYDNLVEQIFNISEVGCSDYILYMKEPQHFMSAYEKVVHLGIVRRSDRKIIILLYDESGDDNISEKVPEILSMKETSYVANILIITRSVNNSECTSFDLLTHKFVGSDYESYQPFYLDNWDSCTKEFANKVELFPHDMVNMFGKTLKVACFTYKPYVLLDIDTNISPLGRDGIEIRITEEFCRWINCTIEIVREDKGQWGEVFENGTGVGIIGAVKEDKVDLGITALYSWYEEYVMMDFSAPIVRTAITCIAPAPRLLTSWETPLMPFTWYLWLAVVFTFFYASLGYLAADGWTIESNPFLSVFAILIAQGYRENPERLWKLRSVTGWMLVAGLIIGCAYGAGLASTFTVPIYEPSIDTIQDIVDRKMEWGATHDAWIFSLTLSTEPLILQLLSQFRTYTAEELKAKSFTRSMAFSIEKLPAGTFAIGDYITKEAVLDTMLMLEDFYYEQCVVMMRKSSPYTEKLSQLVGRLHQSGLMLAWETQIALKHLNYEVQSGVRLSRSNTDDGIRKPLSMQNVEGVFIIYTMGLIVALAIFVFELIVHLFMKQFCLVRNT